MQKLYSLVKATMSTDMKLFNIKSKSSKYLPLAIAFLFMFSMWSYANMLFEKLAPLHLQAIVLALFVFATAIITIIEGIYKTSSLLFNCRDDQLLLSLPIKKETVLFIRIFKFYIFEVIFHTMFFIPLIIAYIRWAETINISFFLTSFICIFILPILPIIISCIIGIITAYITSHFKYKNIAQISISMIFILLMMYVSLNLDKALEYLAKNATSINDLISKIYYPAGIYATLSTEFNIVKLLVFIAINIFLFILMILVFSKIYYKINSKLKNISASKTININNLKIKTNSKYISLIKKELTIFFKTPVFIINAGFSLVFFIVIAIALTLKFDSIIPFITNPNTFNISKKVLDSNLSLLILGLISFTAYMTSITNSVISLEGRNINILKSLPLKTKEILLSKVYAALALTTPIILVGDIILFIRFKICVIDSLLLILLSLLLPLLSHLIGLIINLKYPKLNAENQTEVVKQSTSSFLAVMIGMVLLVITIGIIVNVVGKFNSTIILFAFSIIFSLIDIILYLYLMKKSTKDFNNLSV